MKKTILTTLSIVVAMVIGVNAQTERKCASHDVMNRQLAAHPEMAATREKIERHTNEYVQNLQNGATATNKVAAVVTIPVVVHVVYNTSTQNISDAQIQSQITVLNNDFRRLNADKTNTPSAFASVAADAQIEFCLAKFDPSGAATTGITRTSTTKTIFDASLDDAKFNSTGGKDAWNTSKYLNLWVVPDIKDGSVTGILGYAQFPGTGSASTDGVVIGYRQFGTTGTAAAPFNKGRTATHEVGHWLNLYHIWGDQICGNDGVSDTPVHYDKNFGCPSYPKSNSCGTSSEMHMNYMDYTDDACMNMFTTGQSNRMNALFAAGGARVGLLTSTGCSGGTVTPSYCASNGTNVSYEYIKNVTLNTINNTTAANAGYGNFTSLSTTLNAGTTYNISLLPGYVGTAYTEYFKVWIDYNNDKDFDDAGENVYTSAGVTAVVTGSFTVPSGTAAVTGTRMRVSMKDGAITSPCEVFTYGEVEDYTINIAGATPTCGNTSGLSATSVTSSSATLNWAAVSGAVSYNVRYKPTAGSTWTTTTSTTNSKAISGLTASTAYEFQVQTVCSAASGTYTASATFTTSAATTCAAPGGLASASVTSTGATLSWTAVSGASSYSLRYRKTGTTTWTTVSNTTTSRVVYLLTASTQYEFQVASVCSGTTGSYSASATFTTASTATCGTDIYEANETLAAAKSITTGTTARALICGSTDVDWFKFANTSTLPHIKVQLSTLPADYELYLYNSAGTLLYSSENGSTTSESIIYNSAPVATYYVKVVGYNSAFNSTSYYSLLATRSSTAYTARMTETTPKEAVDAVENVKSLVLNTVYPNPAVNELNMNVSAIAEGTLTIKVSDVIGREVSVSEISVSEGVNNIQLNTSAYNEGIYLLQISNGKDTLVKRFNVVK